jgi:acyl carrier protein
MTAVAVNEVSETIRQFILSTYLPGESPENLPDDLPLLTSGVLDSLAAVGLISFLERRFGVELDVYDTSVERFDRVMDMAVAVVTKQGTAPAAPRS